MADSEIRNGDFWFFNRDYALTYVLCKALMAEQYARAKVCASWAVSGKRKKTPTNELNIFISKTFFDGKLKVINFLIQAYFFLLLLPALHYCQ